jgi:hypothetical protein
MSCFSDVCPFLIPHRNISALLVKLAALCGIPRFIVVVHKSGSGSQTNPVRIALMMQLAGTCVMPVNFYKVLTVISQVLLHAFRIPEDIFILTTMRTEISTSKM